MSFIPSDDDEHIVRHHKLRAIIRYQSIALFILVAAMCANILFEERPIYYFAMNTQYKTKPVYGMGRPVYTYQAVTSWATMAASNILNFGFHDIEQRLAENRRYFTEKGAESFRAAVEKSDLIERVKTKQQVVTAAPIGAPVIIGTKKDPVIGTTWTLQIPFTITIVSGKQTQSQQRILMMKIVTVPPSKNIAGLGIDNWVEGNM